MDISVLKSQTASEYAALLSNPDFLKVLKSSSGSQSTSNSSLLATLEKLSSLLNSSSKNSNIGATSDSQQLLKNLSSTNASSSSSQLLDNSQSLVDDLIKHADMLQSMLDLEMTPPETGIEDLFAKFREIISKLDNETRKLHREVQDKKPKTVYELRPSSNSEDGFDHSLMIKV